MTQQQLFNKIAELATMFKLAEPQAKSERPQAKAPVPQQKASVPQQNNVPVKDATPGQRLQLLDARDVAGADPNKDYGRRSVAWGKSSYKDYSSEGSFGKAFAAARKEGTGQFHFNNQIYGTNLAKPKTADPRVTNPAPLSEIEPKGPMFQAPRAFEHSTDSVGKTPAKKQYGATDSVGKTPAKKQYVATNRNITQQTEV